MGIDRDKTENGNFRLSGIIFEIVSIFRLDKIDIRYTDKNENGNGKNKKL
jgi:hypothetical protein